MVVEITEGVVELISVEEITEAVVELISVEEEITGVGMVITEAGVSISVMLVTSNLTTLRPGLKALVLCFGLLDAHYTVTKLICLRVLCVFLLVLFLFL